MSDAENYEIEVNFTPIVSLPLVENALEDSFEEVIFEKEVIAYTYDTEVIPNEWKERGVGKLRILKEKEDGKYRILMRRNQVKKVCLNHLIHDHFKVIKHQNKGTTLIWFASQDLSDGLPEKRSFAAKFSTIGDCEQFMNEVDKILKELPTAKNVEITHKDEIEEKSDSKNQIKTEEKQQQCGEGETEEISIKVGDLNI